MARSLEETLVCPACRVALVDEADGELRCPVEGTTYVRRGGIWRFVEPREDPSIAEFLGHYRTVRRDEGWGTGEPEYYRELPFRDTSGRHVEIWNIRAATHRLFAASVLAPMEADLPRLRIVDLGAGNCWLSHLLVRRGHEVTAVDLDDDPIDGLGAHIHYDPGSRIDIVQASFDRLPLADESADLAIYNGSLHYSSDYEPTLREALRVLAPTGRIVIIDSPVYGSAAAGEAMLQERTEAFRAAYGAQAPTSRHEGFLTAARLDEVGLRLDVGWQMLHPPLGLRGRLRPIKNRLLGRREQARFPVIVGALSPR